MGSLCVEICTQGCAAWDHLLQWTAHRPGRKSDFQLRQLCRLTACCRVLQKRKVTQDDAGCLDHHSRPDMQEAIKETDQPL